MSLPRSPTSVQKCGRGCQFCSSGLQANRKGGPTSVAKLPNHKSLDIVYFPSCFADLMGYAMFSSRGRFHQTRFRIARLLFMWVNIVLLLAFFTSTGTAQIFNGLYEFQGGMDGGSPNDLVRDSAGNLYGTTIVGGKGGLTLEPSSSWTCWARKQFFITSWEGLMVHNPTET